MLSKILEIQIMHTFDDDERKKNDFSKCITWARKDVDQDRHQNGKSDLDSDWQEMIPIDSNYSYKIIKPYVKPVLKSPTTVTEDCSYNFIRLVSLTAIFKNKCCGSTLSALTRRGKHVWDCPLLCRAGIVVRPV
jgi:hypothetical protein